MPDILEKVLQPFWEHLLKLHSLVIQAQGLHRPADGMQMPLFLSHVMQHVPLYRWSLSQVLLGTQPYYLSIQMDRFQREEEFTHFLKRMPTNSVHPWTAQLRFSTPDRLGWLVASEPILQRAHLHLEFKVAPRATHTLMRILRTQQALPPGPPVQWRSPKEKMHLLSGCDVYCSVSGGDSDSSSGRLYRNPGGALVYMMGDLQHLLDNQKGFGTPSRIPMKTLIVTPAVVTALGEHPPAKRPRPDGEI